MIIYKNRENKKLKPISSLRFSYGNISKNKIK